MPKVGMNLPMGIKYSVVRARFGGRAGRAILAAFVGSLLSITAATPALAHYQVSSVIDCGFSHLKQCGYGGVYDGAHHVIFACDTYADGHGVITYYWLWNGQTGGISDPNGSAAGCGSAIVGSDTNPIYQYQFCYKASSTFNECYLITTVT
ncbi:hypothetical protein [Dactylosporangium sp. NPDC049140]|uniref:hypothetical protein n=1 Tax=Dactylosporangium sp. NPDC049140 TaxID=3155647 RepID=UPI0033DD76EE